MYPLRPLPSLPPPRALYRAYLRHLRCLPDPHVWSVLAPRFKELARSLGRPLPPIPPGIPPMPIGVRGEEVLLKPDGRVKVEVDGQWHPEHVAAKGKDKTRRGREMERRRKEEEREEVDPEKVAQDEAWTAYAYAREVHVRNGRKARTALDHLRMAVSVHPHALERILQVAYGQRGRVRWELVKSITESSPLTLADWPAPIPVPGRPCASPCAPTFPPAAMQPLPGPLRALQARFPGQDRRARLKPLPATRVRSDAMRQHAWHWAHCGVPLTLPENAHSTHTGWEGRGVVEALEVLAGLRRVPGEHGELDARALPTFAHLPPSLRRLFPRRTHTAPEPVARPRRADVRPNERSWSEPRRLTPRLLRRTYRRLYEGIPRVRVSNGEPKPASTAASGNPAYPEPSLLLNWSRAAHDMLGKVVARFTRATPEEMGWATEALAMAVEEPKKIRGRKGDKRLVDIKSKAAVKESKTKVAAATKTSSAPRKESGKGDDVGQAEGFNPTPVQPSGKQQK